MSDTFRMLTDGPISWAQQAIEWKAAAQKLERQIDAAHEILLAVKFNESAMNMYTAISEALRVIEEGLG